VPMEPGRLKHAGDALLVLAVVLGIVAMLLFERSMANVDPGQYLRGGALSDAQQASLTTTLDLVTQLMNWSVAVIGATGFFLRLTIEKTVAVRRRDLLVVFAIIVLAVLSLFLGHLVIDHVAQALSLDQFPVHSEKVRTLGRYQYYAGLGSIALFGIHVFQFFWTRTNADSAEAPS
jgi:hypothetical protein